MPHYSEYSERQNEIIDRLESWGDLPLGYVGNKVGNNFTARHIDAILRLPEQVRERAIISCLPEPWRRNIFIEKLADLPSIIRLAEKFGLQPIEIADIVLRKVSKRAKMHYIQNPPIPTHPGEILTDADIAARKREINSYITDHKETLTKIIESHLADIKKVSLEHAEAALKRFYTEFGKTAPGMPKAAPAHEIKLRERIGIDSVVPKKDREVRRMNSDFPLRSAPEFTYHKKITQRGKRRLTALEKETLISTKKTKVNLIGKQPLGRRIVNRTKRTKAAVGNRLRHILAR